MKKIKSYLQFIFKDQRIILLALSVFLLTLVLVGMTNSSAPTGQEPTFWQDLTWWGKWLDPLSGAGVFLITLLIGWTQLKEEWEESLEKRLTVIYRFQNREVMLCKKAYLTAEGDIRNLGQQIGGQMAETRDLKFKANHIESKRMGVSENEFKEGQYFVHYEVEFELTQLPNEKFKDANLVWYEPDRVTNAEEWLPLVQHEEAIEKE